MRGPPVNRLLLRLAYFVCVLSPVDGVAEVRLKV